MNVFASRLTNNQSWVVPISVMSMVLGFLVMTAWTTEVNRKSRYSAMMDTDQQDRILGGTLDFQEKYAQLNSEVTKLRKEKTRLENSLANQNSGSKVLNDQLQDLKMFASMTDVEGPGIVVTLRDAPKTSGLDGPLRTIHDYDVLLVMNDLWIAGAEAMAVNGVRVSSRSTVKCIGPVVLIDSERFPTPIVIEVVGDREKLLNALKIPEGPFEILQAEYPGMASAEGARVLHLPAYSGATEFKWAKVPQVKK